MSVGNLSHGERLGAELRSLRQEARLTQQALSRVSGVGTTTIKDAEKGVQIPKADTLRLLADGLATYAPGRRDDDLALDYYGRLMRAAGYIAGDEPQRPADPEPPDEPWAPLRKLPGASVALTELARGVPNWNEDDRHFVEGTLEQLAQRFGLPADSR